MNWEGKSSHIRLEKGILQGGRHSSQIFSITLEALFHEMYAKSRLSGENEWVVLY